MAVAREVYIGTVKRVRMLNAHNIDPKPYEGFQWECSCGATNSSEFHKHHPKLEYSPFTYVSTMNEAERRLDKHLLTHSRTRTREDDDSVPDDFPHAQRTDDVHRIQPARPDASEDAQTQTMIGGRRSGETLDFFQRHRWVFFDNNELINLNQALVHLGCSCSDHNELLKETQDEMRRRDVPIT